MQESITCKRRVFGYLIRLLYTIPLMFLYKNYGGTKLDIRFLIQVIFLFSYSIASLIWDYLNSKIINLDDMIIITGFNAIVMITVFAYSHPVSGFLISAFCLFESFVFLFALDAAKIRKEKSEPDNTAEEENEPANETEDESFADAETDTEVDVDAQVAADETDEFQKTNSSNIYDDFDPRFLDA